MAEGATGLGFARGYPEVLGDSLLGYPMPAGYGLEEFLSETARGVFYPFWNERFWTENYLYLSVSLAYFLVVLGVWYAFLLPEEEKRRTWILSTHQSGVSAVLSVPLIASLCLAAHREGALGVKAFMLSNTSLSSFMSCFFLVFLFLDTAICTTLYRSHFQWLTGWIHHGAYIALLSTGLYWRYSVGIMLFFIEELPTFLFGLGNLHPPLKTDLGFGLTFLAMRLIYHAVLSAFVVVYLHNYCFGYVANVVTMALHTWWFYRWFTRMQRLRAARQAQGLQEADTLLVPKPGDAQATCPETAHPMPDQRSATRDFRHRPSQQTAWAY